MTPGMTGDLVTIVVHVLNDVAPVLINGTLADIVTSNEESSPTASGLEFRHDLLSIDVRTIIISNSNRAWLQA